MRLQVKDTFCLSQLPLCTRAPLILKQRILVALTTTWPKHPTLIWHLKVFRFLIRIIRAGGIGQHFVSPLDLGFYPGGKNLKSTLDLSIWITFLLWEQNLGSAQCSPLI